MLSCELFLYPGGQAGGGGGGRHHDQHVVESLQVPVVPQQPPHSAHRHLELCLVRLSDGPGRGEALLVLHADAPHVSQPGDLGRQTVVVLPRDLQGLQVLLLPGGLPGVALKDGEEDDIQGGVGGVENLPPHIAAQVVHLLQSELCIGHHLHLLLTYLEDVFSFLLGELQAHVEQGLLQLLVERNLLSLHGAGDEPDCQLGVVGEIVKEEVKPNKQS